MEERGMKLSLIMQGVKFPFKFWIDFRDSN